MKEEIRGKRKRNGEGVRDRLTRRLDLQPDLLGEGGLVELRGRGSVTVRGSGRILQYTPTEIRIAMPHSVLVIRGDGLLCTSYYRGAVGVEGRVEGIFFEEETK